MDKTLIRRLISLTRPYWSTVILALLCGLLASAVMAAIAWLVKPAMDIIFMDKKYQYLKLLPFAVIVLFATKGFLHFCQQYLIQSAGLALIRDTQSRLHNHIIYMPVEYFDKETSGMLISRVLNDVTLINKVISEVIRATVVEIPKIFILLGIAFYRKWDLTLVSLLLVPGLAISAKKLGKKVKQKVAAAQKNMSFLTHRLSESITGVRVIKVFNRETYRNERFIGAAMDVYKDNIKAIKYKELNKLVVDFMTGLAIGSVLFYGGMQVVSGKITPGDFASILTAIYLIFSPAKLIGEAYTTLQGVRAALERIDHVLETPVEDTGKVEIARFNDCISLESVTFRYNPDDPPVLNDISLTIKKGEVLAIIGPSGTGKSTLVNLLPRFYIPSAGSIKLDGIDLRELDIQSLRGLIATVSQDIVLFNDTIRENIAFGNARCSFEQIQWAADMAYATEFIERLPEGFDTIVGERGLSLSGGQRQRIAIARALLKNPPILILDEATSSLDNASEALVQKALEGLMKDRTTIIIAHRLSTISNADRVIAIENASVRTVTNPSDPLLQQVHNL
ncbi:MAG: ABC transporter transmembrane domain-containing protein [Candidatus Magnetobacterium sp. LHC-1]|uniref:ATP-binding cassette domain-containing protein n=1 Tax=Candidatus Magnetobacterium casense TaxID=1455061 RepID=A0ABS6RXB1_9BACT|nr:ABC transporter transmembrane domain-containing protein [Candidatus Magnetobacterium casensis]MBF0608954.1 ATP-binding cassette domain-containing protein [Nitrospirota bacterium]MBV6341256.1 ATP-binding cassette domain-containing protein [Candidatus Magnetobacterium casensis]